jgi:hypothetical protein
LYRRSSGAPASGLLALLLVAGTTPALAHSSDPWDWLIQHVCADTADRPVPADPYDGCPSGTHERRLKLGDPLPYLRHTPPNKDHPLGAQRTDSYPLIDVHTGQTISANDFDYDFFEPFGRFKPGGGDGYDVYWVSNGFVSVGSTRDRNGYSTTFFGPECRPYGGQILFPVSFLKNLVSGVEGSGLLHVHGDYWEQRGESWPGSCDGSMRLSQNSSFRWSFEPAHRFGGIRGSKIKTMDAVVTTLGFPERLTPLRRFHIERFYFTDMYGITRFEAWWPKGAKDPNPACADNPEMNYHGIDFVATACTDISATEILDPPRPRFSWPYPQLNLLSNWHFAEPSLAPWRQVTTSSVNKDLETKVGVSRTQLDTRFSKQAGGVRFLQIDCGEGCAASSAIFQDIPASLLGGAIRFDYGFSGVAESAEPAAVKASLSLIDRSGHVLWSDSFDATVETNYRGIEPSESIYRASSVFLHTSETIPSVHGAQSLRLTLSPEIRGRIDILDAWVMPR